MDTLFHSLEGAQFTINRGVKNHRQKKTEDGVPPQILLFGFINDINSDGRFQPARGSILYPEIEEQLKEIANDMFPELRWNYVQVNKNVETKPHYDKKNIGDSITFTLGDFTGGHLGTDCGSIDINKRPFRFNGSKVRHWTEPWEGGNRYCVIYYTGKVRISPEIQRVMPMIKPESKTDYMVMDEICRKDTYKINAMVELGETWLDIGANIGVFSLRCAEIGATVHAYEPEKRNWLKLKETAQHFPEYIKVEKRCAVWDRHADQISLSLERNGNWRHTIKRQIRGRLTQAAECIDAGTDLPSEYDGIKMDCEGCEVDIFNRLVETGKLPRKLIMEYDGKYHPKLEQFNEFIEVLKATYRSVTIPNPPSKDLDAFFPSGIVIICNGR
jgi:FkbM family methyltransferase